MKEFCLPGDNRWRALLGNAWSTILCDKGGPGGRSIDLSSMDPERVPLVSSGSKVTMTSLTI